MIWGKPGSSFTFEVAELNGIPHDLIDRAKGKLNPKKVRLDGLIASLQKEKTRHVKLTDRQLKAEHAAQEARRDFEQQSAKLEERQASVQRMGTEQNAALVRGKKTAAVSSTGLSRDRPTRPCWKTSENTSL